MNRRAQMDRQPMKPGRVRTTAGQGFAFVPHRFLRDGFLATLGRDETLLYFFLVLAADRYGISFYHYDRICSILMLTADDYIKARNGLIEKDLLAFDGTRFQVLALPQRPALPNPQQQTPTLTTDQEMLEHDPATIRQAIRKSMMIED